MKIKEYEDTSKNALARKIQTTYAAKLDKSSTQLVMDMLAKLYSKPYAAALREYVSNAYDANVEAHATKPVEVHLPEVDEPYLSVHDYGNGLDYMGIVSVFANFGTSTKRDSDNLIGGFGIGSKSGLAISDSIQITSISNGLLNEFVLERTPNGIFTRFIKENKETSEVSGTTVTIDLSDKIKDSYNEDHYYNYLSPSTTLCGWSKNEVYITNKKFESINEYRIPDTWYFNGWEYKQPRYQLREGNLKGFLVGKVFYDIPNRFLFQKTIEFNSAASLVIPFDIQDIKVTYSRENIDFNDKNTLNHIENALALAETHVKKEYADVANDTTLQPYEKIKKLYNMGIDLFHISESTKKQSAHIERLLDEPAVIVKKNFDGRSGKYTASISSNKVEIDDVVSLFLMFDTDIPKRPALKQFINWLMTSTDDTHKDIKELLTQTNLCGVVATTKKGYAKMYHTYETPAINVQAAYNTFVPKNNKAVVDLSHHEFTYYDRWSQKGKSLIDQLWLADKKVVILDPKIKRTANTYNIRSLSKLLVNNPEAIWNDVLVVITKNKKEYEYLTNLSTNAKAISSDDIDAMSAITSKWSHSKNIDNVIITAYFFRNLMLNSDKNLDNNLWLTSPFAHQRYIERKMCAIITGYNDWHQYGNKDLTTKAYYSYAEKQATQMNASESQDIINYISKTCATEIDELNKMMDELDAFIK